MIDEVKIEKTSVYLNKAKTVALICHANPDGDTICSAIALAVALKKLGKTAEVFCDDNLPSKLSFLPYSDIVNVGGMKKYELAVAIDCSDAERFNYVGKYFNKADARLVIDHHKTNAKFADYTLCDSSASATAELIFWVIKKLEKQNNVQLFDEKIAELIFSGIVTDSGCFSFSNTTAETLWIASELKKYDFFADVAIYNLIKNKSVNQFKLKNKVLNNAKFFEEDQIGIITFRTDDFKETNTSSEDTEGVIVDLINVNSVKIAFSVAEVYDKYFRVSIRTKNNIDASQIAAVFGGGGHAKAAGCRLSGFYEDVVDKLLKAARDML